MDGHPQYDFSEPATYTGATTPTDWPPAVACTRALVTLALKKNYLNAAAIFPPSTVVIFATVLSDNAN